MADWKLESRRIEEIFSLVYCIVAATSTTSPSKGFLTPCSKIRLVSIPNSKNKGFKVYISKINENFNQDVEIGVLNRRAWVLQERALLYCTIHFTNG